MNTFLKILMGISVAAGALISAGILPASLGGIAAAVGAFAGVMHPSPTTVTK